MTPLSLFGGTGFVLGHYHRLYPDTLVECREELFPSHDDVLYGISTTDNYAPLRGNLEIDIATNLTHLMRVLPNVRGRFAFLSSWFVYGDNSTLTYPAREEDACYPTGFYSSTKLCAEQMLASYCATRAAGLLDSGPSTYQILRLSNVIGNDPRAGSRKNALEHMLGKVVRGEDVEVYEGQCYRDVLHVEDTCRAIRMVIEHGTPNTVYNVGRGVSHRMVDLIDYAIDRLDSPSVIRTVPVPAFHRIVQTESFHMDTRRLQLLGFRPELSIEQSIDRVLEGIARDQGRCLRIQTVSITP